MITYADEVAYALLMRHLSYDQARMFIKERRFYVSGPDGSEWIVHDGSRVGSGEVPFNVDCIRGRWAGMSVCWFPRPADRMMCPVGDVLLAQKLWLETDPDRLLDSRTPTRYVRKQWPNPHRR